MKIEMLPAERGDCLWVTYGTPERHVLIDGGPVQTMGTLVPELERRLAALGPGDDRVELLVQTHIDADHIQGLTSLLSDPERVKLFRDVWLNGYRHVQSAVLGAPDAEMLTASLLLHPQRWNAAFGGEAVCVPRSGPLPVVELAGGLKLTLLAPTREALAALAPEWEKAVGELAGKGRPTPASRRRGGVLGFDADVAAAAPFKEDRSKPNSAGIAFIAEADGRRVLFLADVPPRFVLAAFDRLGPGAQRFDAVKLSHHGSRNNTSLELCRRISSPRWLVSTNGAQFGHPDAEALARVIVTQDRPTFWFNYETKFAADVVAGAGSRYSVELPPMRGGKRGEGIVVDLGVAG